MNTERSQIDRLFEAADAILDALDSGEERGPRVLMSLDDEPPPPRPGEPPVFTRAELVEAMTMLLRMGYSRDEKAAR